MRKVIEVSPNDDYSLDLKFDDGQLKHFDLTPYLEYEVFRELKDLQYFKQVRIAYGTVQWPHEQDISPDTLYLEGIDVASCPPRRSDSSGEPSSSEGPGSTRHETLP